MGFSLYRGTLASGIDTVLDIIAFGVQLEGADLMVTGEGKFDGQSVTGKVISGVVLDAKKQKDERAYAPSSFFCMKLRHYPKSVSSRNTSPDAASKAPMMRVRRVTPRMLIA